MPHNTCQESGQFFFFFNQKITTERNLNYNEHEQWMEKKVSIRER